tara:strand:- start:811 stop:1122 length:312 start_codon:yes stop_codon:yes gene_type:complete
MIKNIIVSNQYTEIVSAPEGQNYANLGIYFCNTSDEADVIDVFVTGSGNTPGDLTKVIAQLSIPPKETFQFGNEKFLLGSGESIGASSVVGNRVSATVTYTDI